MNKNYTTYSQQQQRNDITISRQKRNERPVLSCESRKEKEGKKERNTVKNEQDNLTRHDKGFV